MKDIMLDLETMSLSDNAAILSIGAVQFDLFTGKMGNTFYQNVNLESCARKGLDINAGTVLWWMKQSDAARNILYDRALELYQACIMFTDFIIDVGNGKVKGISLWGNGKEFDNKIIRNAYSTVDLNFPLPYYRDSDVRTVVDIAKRIDVDWHKPERKGTHHNALDDAMYQVEYLCKAWDTIESN